MASVADSRMCSTMSEACYHGGAFFERIGTDFRALERRHDVINADVLDAWFPPAPGVLAVLHEHLDWVLRTSPPTHCEGMVRAIGAARQIPEQCIVPGAGSSDLIFRAFPRWLAPPSRVLLLDPTYGEYRHVLEQVIGCCVERFELESNYRLELDHFEERIRALEPDLVVIVNPNNPTGQHVPRADLETFLRRVQPGTRFWIDEAYLDYVDSAESLERFAAGSENVVVCKSMSKVYALSGARAAYLCAGPTIAAELRARTPPWAISLPGQIAAVFALWDSAYYRRRYAETHGLRESLAERLGAVGLNVLPGAANFLLCRLPADAPNVSAVLAHARERGLYLRDVSSMTTRPDHRTFRIAVKDAATNERIVTLLAGVLCRPGG